MEELCSTRNEIHRSILQEEEEEQKLQDDRILTEKLAKVNESLARNIASRTALTRPLLKPKLRL